MTLPAPLLAIDPALACTGWAFFVEGLLTDCGIVRTAPIDPLPARLAKAAREIIRRDELRAWAPFDLIIEWPQVYTYGKSKGDPNDLLPVAGVAAVCAATLAYDARPARLVKPAEWKAQVPKDVHNARVLARLTPHEAAILARSGIPRSLQHNVIDAIGLGLFGLGRMGRNHVDIGGPLGAANADQEAVTGKRRAPRGRRVAGA